MKLRALYSLHARIIYAYIYEAIFGKKEGGKIKHRRMGRVFFFFFFLGGDFRASAGENILARDLSAHPPPSPNKTRPIRLCLKLDRPPSSSISRMSASPRSRGPRTGAWWQYNNIIHDWNLWHVWWTLIIFERFYQTVKFKRLTWRDCNSRTWNNLNFGGNSLNSLF